eukprot:115265_1
MVSYQRLHLLILCFLFIGQYLISFDYNSNGNTIINIISSESEGCIYLKWLFYYNRIILPSLNALSLVIWLYVLFMCPECFPTRFLHKLFPRYCFPLIMAIISPYFIFNFNRFNNQYINDLFHHILYAQLIYLTPS